MPELPEVQTTTNGLKEKVLLRAFFDIWTDWEKIVKMPNKFKLFKKQIKNKKIIKIYRRAKNIIFNLSDGISLLIHLKMTGHLLFGSWKKIDNKWIPVEENSPLNDPYNRFLHFIFFLDNNKMLALSDVRKFAKIELWQTEELEKELEKLGPEPLDKNFTFESFKNCFNKKRGKIKQIIMKPEVIAGIGNIYASEILWRAKVNPEKLVQNLNNNELNKIYKVMRKILQIAINLGGESFSDYRKIDGTKGDFDKKRMVYKRENETCKHCKKTKIIRKKIAGRSTFYCPFCQKL